MNMHHPGLRPIYLTMVWVLLWAILIQIGFAFFGIPLGLHRVLGGTIALASMALVFLTFAARLPRATRTISALMLLLLGLQAAFIGLRAQMPSLVAVHAVNAFVILALALIIALDAEDTVQSIPAAGRSDR